MFSIQNLAERLGCRINSLSTVGINKVRTSNDCDLSWFKKILSLAFPLLTFSTIHPPRNITSQILLIFNQHSQLPSSGPRRNLAVRFWSAGFPKAIRQNTAFTLGGRSSGNSFSEYSLLISRWAFLYSRSKAAERNIGKKYWVMMQERITGSREVSSIKPFIVIVLKTPFRMCSWLDWETFKGDRVGIEHNTFIER